MKAAIAVDNEDRAKAETLILSISQSLCVAATSITIEERPPNPRLASILADIAEQSPLTFHQLSEHIFSFARALREYLVKPETKGDTMVRCLRLVRVALVHDTIEKRY
jgi:acyl-coenzyme A synthetase/AMP-(fatty) acid ligase